MQTDTLSPLPKNWAGIVVIEDRSVQCECGWVTTGPLETLWPAFEVHREAVTH